MQTVADQVRCRRNAQTGSCFIYIQLKRLITSYITINLERGSCKLVRFGFGGDKVKDKVNEKSKLTDSVG